MSPSSLRDESTPVDSIAALSDPLSSMSSLASLVPLLKLAYDARPPPTTGRLVLLMRTLSPAPRPPKAAAYSPDAAAAAFANFLSPVLNGLAGMQDFEAAVDGFARPDVFRDFWTLRGRCLITGDGPAPAVGGGAGFLDVFCRDQSCRVALGAETGCLMLVPGDAQVGDEVWVGKGEAPRLTRKSSQVGEAIVDHVEVSGQC